MKKIQKKYIFSQCVYIWQRFLLICINFNFEFLSSDAADFQNYFASAEI